MILLFKRKSVKYFDCFYCHKEKWNIFKM